MRNQNKYKLLDLTQKWNLISLLWFVIPFVALLLEIIRIPIQINNYLIFKNVFWHTIREQNLYSFYPNEYSDKNHYGPLFSLLIAPFALFPDYIGVILWGMFNVSILFYAINKLPISNWGKSIILLIALIENLTSIQNVQSNPMICSWIVLTYVSIKENKLGLAAFIIVAGTFIKLYGIVGLPFIFLSKDYKKIIGYLFLWAFILFCLPMFISSYDFIIQTYKDWYFCLIEKNSENILASVNGGMQDISVMGLIKRTTGYYKLQNFYILVPAATIMLMPLYRFSKLNNLKYQLTYLAQILIGVVIFSSSAESPTYVIAVVGFGIWYVLHAPKPPMWIFCLLLLTLLLTVFSPTDLFPRSLRESFILKYSLKTLPCFIAWTIISFNLLFANFSEPTLHEKEA